MRSPDAIQLPPLRTTNWLITQQRFFRWGLLLSIACHLALLAWQRAAPPQPPANPSELEIVMVNSATESDPLLANLLAQTNIDGGGQREQGHMATLVPHTGDSVEPVMLEALVQQRQQLALQQQLLFTQLRALQTTTLGQSTPSPAEITQQAGEDEIDQDRVLLNAQIAVIARRIESDNAQPRKYFDAPSARKTLYASYIDQWRQRIEQIGTEHYPMGVEGKAYGSVQATLTVRADGSIVDLTINRPSNSPLLNQAVRRIAQLSAPFAPFPADMARHIDQLVLTRTWHFVNGTLETQQP